MKLNSMTGFGESSGFIKFEDRSEAKIKILFKSLNHRFLDLSLRLPSFCSSLEADISKIIKNKLSRGRVELQITFDSLEGESLLNVNSKLLESSINTLSVTKVEGVSDDILIKSALPILLARREVMDFSSQKRISGSEARDFMKLLENALDDLIQSRKNEGESLAKEILSIILILEKKLQSIDEYSSETPEIIKQRFIERLAKLYDSFKEDDQRIMQEIAILSDRIDVREEVVRLKSHLDFFKQSFSEGGRKLEFIVQEMGREVNTIGAKTSQIEVSKLVIESKSYLEKLREQLQNVE